MLESPQQNCIPATPAFLMSQMSDPAIVSAICSPFLNCQDNLVQNSGLDFTRQEAFSLHLVQTVLIPNIVQMINANNSEAMQNLPKLSELIISNFPNDGVDLIKNHILPALLNNYRSSASPTNSDSFNLISNIISTIPIENRDHITVDIISKISCEAETKMRLLALHLIPIVNDSNLVLVHFRSLSLDRAIPVKCELIKMLPECHFDQSFINYLLLNSIKDQNLSIRRAAASIYGKIAPYLLDTFTPLLENPDTVRAALKSVQPIVVKNGLKPLSTSFETACYLDHELSAAVVLNISRLVSEEEKPLVLHFAYLLKNTKNIITHLYKFSEVFSDKDFFVSMLVPDLSYPHAAQQWRLRKELINQAEMFMPVLHDKLIPIAEAFSNDPIAIIRNLSIDFWISLINDTNNAEDKMHVINEIKGLLTDSSNWHTRLVLAKLIVQLGIEPYFIDSAEKLSHDEVSNIRFAIAEAALNTPYFDQFFSNCEDTDIQSLSISH